MHISRRAFIKTALSTIAIPTLIPVNSVFAQREENWHIYEITTEAELDSQGQDAQVWLPLPLLKDTPFFKTLSIEADTLAQVGISNTPTGQARFLRAHWSSDIEEKKIKLITRVATRERFSQLNHQNAHLHLSQKERKFWTRPTELLPTDGIILQRAHEIIRSLPNNATNIDKSKAIYNWVVDNTFRNPKTRGCGVGDVRLMLETDNLGGKCADINAVYVALSRAVGIPARDVYGIRVADSARGYKSLGKSGDISKAQHCRAEFFADGYGWVAVDPADVRKVILEEAGGLPITDPKVVAIRDYLFGNWEMNWMAYNYDHDLLLPGSQLGELGKIGYLMYPQAEINGNRLDSLDPDSFKYKITSKLISS